MPDEIGDFQTSGLTWAERAGLGGLEAVLSPTGGGRRNAFTHRVHRLAARASLSHFRGRVLLVDFGCGNGRFSGFFAHRFTEVLGLDVTAEMIAAAGELGIPNATFQRNDGVGIPLADGQADGIWVCAVLRYSLLVERPVYDRIAREMHRVLQPGGCVVNCEMYLDGGPEAFLPAFKAAGFELESLSVLQRHLGLLERLASHRYAPAACLPLTAALSAGLRRRFDSPWRPSDRFSDYLFVWRKPSASRAAVKRAGPTTTGEG
ncbi:MAG: class I SAM-dependent methyltransferase [Caulobacteraceae bacterium]|nr:class I SAM-dependent methyltransferase [Caulobacteraceae bacterium]